MRSLDIDCDQAALRQMTTRDLQASYVELFGEPPRSRHKEHLIRRIAWRCQALAEGGLSQRARRRAAELADDGDLRLSRPQKPRSQTTRSKVSTDAPHDRRLPTPGTLLVRHYRGRTLEVMVLQQGFQYDGQVFPSLTAVARQITGKHWNGFHFFGLSKKGLKR